ncbi:hypothetical protein B0O99DRAFT_688025 [Bisporella sp. PMI_857]|nr:hypothetical protein B0O99DRAFT_688025 [Bisporella sp. PMI_857]
MADPLGLLYNPRVEEGEQQMRKALHDEWRKYAAQRYEERYKERQREVELLTPGTLSYDLAHEEAKRAYEEWQSCLTNTDDTASDELADIQHMEPDEWEKGLEGWQSVGYFSSSPSGDIDNGGEYDDNYARRNVGLAESVGKRRFRHTDVEEVDVKTQVELSPKQLEDLVAALEETILEQPEPKRFQANVELSQEEREDLVVAFEDPIGQQA